MLSRIKNSTVFVVALMLASHSVLAECVVVEGRPIPEFVQSSDNLRLNIRREGKAAPGAVVAVWRYGSAVPYVVLQADDNGVVVLKRLPDGKYEVNVFDQNGKSTGTDVEVSPGKARKVTSIDVSLGNGVSGDVATDVANVRRFNGVVVDPGGGGIPGAVIVVVRSGVPGKLIQSSSASDGSFAIDLANGEYTAFVRGLSGFRHKVVRFVISELGTESLSISLKIGGC